MNIEQNRRRFISALRANPLGLHQHQDSTLYNERKGTVCALGLGCFEFDVDMSMNLPDCPDPYRRMTELLDIDDTTMSLMWKWNDTYRAPFGQIADSLEDRWFPVTIEAEDLTEI